MTTVTCDRCGAEIVETNPEWYKIPVSMYPEAFQGIMSRFDLCPDCRDDLVAWIREGVKDDQI